MKNLLWLLLGFILGVGAALLIGWVLFPVEYANSTPDTLRSDYKDEYIRLISLSYQVDGDLALVEQRLASLGGEPVTKPLVDLTERWIAQARSERLIVPLIHLARDLGAETFAMQQYMQRGAP